MYILYIYICVYITHIYKYICIYLYMYITHIYKTLHIFLEMKEKVAKDHSSTEGLVF